MKKIILSVASGYLGVSAFVGSAYATNGVWINNNTANWSLGTNWQSGAIADGAGSIADFSQLNITANRTVTIDTTSRTVGSLLLGDTTAAPTFSIYSIAASGGATLTFNNSGSAANLTQVVNTGANIVSAPIVLADDLNINNNSTSALTVSGGITGAKSIINQGSGIGGVTIAGIIAPNVAGVIQNSATSILTLSGTNTFTTGVTIKSGAVLVNNAAALGTGTLLLGDTSGSANATVAFNSFTVTNNITVQAGSSGTLTIMGNGGAAGRPTGNIVLNNDATLGVDGGGNTGRNTGAYLATTGTISGTGNLNLNVSGNLSTTNNGGAPQMDSLVVTGAVTTSGSVNNVGTGSGRAAINGAINNASGLNQNSATSMLTLGGANTYSGGTNVNAGVLRIAANTALSANSAVTVASGGTLQLQAASAATNTVTISGKGTSYSYGAIDSTNNSSLASAIVMLADSTVSSDLSGTTLTLSGNITGSGKTLTTSGVGTVLLGGVLGTGTGGVIKEGTGLLTLSGANTYTGLTLVNNGTVLLNNANALGGGGLITLNGGGLRLSATNTADLGSRIVNSTGPVSLDTNAQNATYSGINSSNSGGLSKLGSGRLTLSGTNSYSGITTVNAGVLAVSAASALPGQVFIDTNGSLNSGGANANVQAWLNSGSITSGSTGVIALTGSSSENIDFTGYGTLGLGASANSTYTGTITPAGSTYRLGGGGATLTLSGTNTLTGSNGLIVSGLVAISGANNLSGNTSVNSGTLTLSGTAGSLASSAVTVNPGASLAITSSTTATPVTRASSVTLNRSTLAITGNATANSTDAITNALTIGSGGNSTITLAANAARNTLLTAGSYVHNAGGTVLFRGTSLGLNNLGTVNSANITLATPNLVGGTGINTTDEGILVGAVGDSNSGGTGFGSTGGLLTYDAAKGVRQITAYSNTITDGQTQLDNVQLAASTGLVTTTVNSDTTINSLSIKTSGVVGAAVALTGTGKLTLNSGVLYAGSVTSTTISTVSNALDFNGREGMILAGGSTDLTLSGTLSNTGGNGLTVYGTKTVNLTGTSANTYTGTTTINGGTLALGKTAGVDAIAGSIVINAGTLTENAANQIADTANITVNSGALNFATETINNLTMNGGSAASGGALTINGNLDVSGGASFTSGVNDAVNILGTTNLSNGGTLRVQRSQAVNGAYDSVATVTGLNITNSSSGAYTAVTVDYGSGLGQSGGKLILDGDVTFTGNSTNTNTTTIDGTKGTGRQGVIALRGFSSGDRVFTVADGAANTDLTVAAPLVDGTGGASGLVKAGAGVMALSGDNLYTGGTTVNAGTLLVATSSSLAGATGAVNVTGGTLSSSVTSASFGGDLSVAGGTLTANGSSVGSFTLAANADFLLSSGTVGLTFASTSSFDQIVGSGAGSTFTITGGTLNLGGTVTDYLASYQILSGFNSGSVSGLTISNYDTANYTASLSNSGVLSFSAVPEPSTYALVGMGLGALWFLRRRQSKITKQS